MVEFNLLEAPLFPLLVHASASSPPARIFMEKSIMEKTFFEFC